MEEIMSTHQTSDFAEGFKNISQGQKYIFGGEAYRFIRRMLRDSEIRTKVDAMVQAKNNADNTP